MRVSARVNPFLAATGARPPPDLDLLEARLEELERRARAAWPGVLVSPEVFFGALGRGVAAAGDVLAELPALRCEDVWLAVACAAAHPAALDAFARFTEPELHRIVGRAKRGAMDHEDLRQLVWQKLFVPARGEQPKILEYAGQGDLRAWFRVVATRVYVDASRKRSGQEEAHDGSSAADALFAENGDPEMDYLKRHYRGAFVDAFTAALAALPAEERTALRQQLVDRIGIDQIAATLGVHRATAARRVQKAREALLADTRRRLMIGLGLSRVELESVMRMIESQLHVSVGRLLG